MRTPTFRAVALVALGLGIGLTVGDWGSRAPDPPGPADARTSEPAASAPGTGGPTLAARDAAAAEDRCARFAALRAEAPTPERARALLGARGAGAGLELACLPVRWRLAVLAAGCEAGDALTLEEGSVPLDREPDGTVAPLRDLLLGLGAEALGCVGRVVAASGRPEELSALLCVDAQRAGPGAALESPFSSELLAVALRRHPSSETSWWERVERVRCEGDAALRVLSSELRAVGRAEGGDALARRIQGMLRSVDVASAGGTLHLIAAARSLEPYLDAALFARLTREAADSAWRRTLLAALPPSWQWPLAQEPLDPATLAVLRAWRDEPGPAQDVVGRRLRAELVLTEWQVFGPEEAVRSLEAALAGDPAADGLDDRVAAAVQGCAILEGLVAQGVAPPSLLRARDLLARSFAARDDVALAKAVGRILAFPQARTPRSRELLVRLLDGRVRALPAELLDTLLSK